MHGFYVAIGVRTHVTTLYDDYSAKVLDAHF